jgi:hypothetical protein
MITPESKSTTIHYTVDAEPQQTDKTRMTAAEILGKAGLNPEEYYLVKEEPTRDSYRGQPNETILMHEGEVFISIHFGPTPVS